MPLFDFQCSKCNHKFEEFASSSAKPPACPECSAETKKLISGGSFELKGSGWYRDGYGLKKST